MANIDKINGIDEDDISHHNGGAAALYTSKNGDTWVHVTYTAATGGTRTDGQGEVFVLIRDTVCQRIHFTYKSS